jgi:hypothetical protein
MSGVTQILQAIDQGNVEAADKLLPLVYEELRYPRPHPGDADPERHRAAKRRRGIRIASGFVALHPKTQPGQSRLPWRTVR